MNLSGTINGGTDTSLQTQATGSLFVEPLAYSGEPMTDAQLPVVVRTVLNLQRDTIDYWKGLSCFFNKWWHPEKDRITLPFCFFHIVQYSEVGQAEVSKKRLILYEPPTEEDTAASQNDPLRRGLMQTVVDNVVVQPTEYKMQVIVPFLPFGNYIRHGGQIMSVLSKTLSTVLNENEPGMQGTIRYIREQLDGLLGSDGYKAKVDSAYNNLNGFLQQEISGIMNGDAMVNKTSLDAMFKSGAILKFKTWMGFDYKYVVITNKTAEKRSAEDDVWRVDLTVQEMPVLSLSPVLGTTAPISRSWMLNSVNKLGELTFGESRVGLSVPAFNEKAEEGAASGSPA